MVTLAAATLSLSGLSPIASRREIESMSSSESLQELVVSRSRAAERSPGDAKRLYWYLDALLDQRKSEDPLLSKDPPLKIAERTMAQASRMLLSAPKDPYALMLAGAIFRAYPNPLRFPYTWETKSYRGFDGKMRQTRVAVTRIEDVAPEQKVWRARAAKIDPDNIAVVAWQAQALSPARALERWLRVDPTCYRDRPSPNVEFVLTTLYEKLGRTEAAVRRMKEVDAKLARLGGDHLRRRIFVRDHPDFAERHKRLLGR